MAAAPRWVNPSTPQAESAALSPRIRHMLALILAHQAAICEPKKGVLELHFNGRQVEAHLSGRLALDG